MANIKLAQQVKILEKKQKIMIDSMFSVGQDSQKLKKHYPYLDWMLEDDEQIKPPINYTSVAELEK